MVGSSSGASLEAWPELQAQVFGKGQDGLGGAPCPLGAGGLLAAQG